MDFATRQRVYGNLYRAASAGFKRAQTIHAREQERGKTDTSVRQTRRMYHAAEALRSAAWRYADAQRSLFQIGR